jgi:hypothetical protein
LYDQAEEAEEIQKKVSTTQNKAHSPALSKRYIVYDAPAPFLPECLIALAPTAAFVVTLGNKIIASRHHILAVLEHLSKLRIPRIRIVDRLLLLLVPHPIPLPLGHFFLIRGLRWRSGREVIPRIRPSLNQQLDDLQAELLLGPRERNGLVQRRVALHLVYGIDLETLLVQELI